MSINQHVRKFSTVGFYLNIALHRMFCVGVLLLMGISLSACSDSTRHGLKIHSNHSFEHPKHWGFIDKNGAVVIKPQFRTSGAFVDNIAIVGSGPNKMKVSRIAIDKSGRQLFPSSFANISRAGEGLFTVTGPIGDDDGKARSAAGVNRLPEFRQTYMSLSGDVWKQIYLGCGSFSNGVAVVCVDGTNNTNESARSSIELPRQSKLYFLVNHKGVQIKELRDQPGRQRLNFSEGLLAVRRDGKYGFINTKGEFVIPAEYAYVSDFHEGMAQVCIGSTQSRSFFIDRSGRRAFQQSFESVHDFHEGLAAFGTRAKDEGFIDKSGKKVITAKSDVKGFSDFSEGLSKFTTYESSEGFIDKSGAVVIPAATDIKYGDFHDGLCRAGKMIDKAWRYGYIDKTGKWVIQPAYKEADDFSEGLAAVSFETI